MVLQIVVTPECFGCDEASRLAALMRREFRHRLGVGQERRWRLGLRHRCTA